MILEHYASAPLALDTTRRYDQRPSQFRLYGKPSGLWVSAKGEYDWPWWCLAEEFGKERLLFRHTVTLKPDANILVLDTEAKMHGFNHDYSGGYGNVRKSLADILERQSKDWVRVANDYDGILIAPYHWSLRLESEFSWYYGWDCASGCIWNLDAISVAPGQVVEGLFVTEGAGNEKL